MRQKSRAEGSAEKHVKEIKRKTRRKFSAKEKIRFVLDDPSFAEPVQAALFVNGTVADLVWTRRTK